MKDILPVGEVPERPYSIRDMDDHFSLINFLSDALKKSVLELPEEFLIMSETELKEKAHPTSTDYALRVSFWREFDKAMWKGTGKIVSASIYGGICSEQYFYKAFIRTEAKFAWMIRPMQQYQKEMEAILYRCTERLWELIEIPLKDSKGKMDPKRAEVLLKVVAQVENRVKGMAVQRSEARSLNVNVVTRSKPSQGIETMSSLDERIKQLQAEVDEDGTKDSGEGRAREHQALPPQANKEEREIIHTGLLRSANPVPR